MYYGGDCRPGNDRGGYLETHGFYSNGRFRRRDVDICHGNAAVWDQPFPLQKVYGGKEAGVGFADRAIRVRPLLYTERSIVDIVRAWHVRAWQGH